MKALLNCEIDYFPSIHLNHIYDGFEKLRKLGIIEISIKKSNGNRDKPLLNVVINNRYKVIYDALDGFNWIDDSVEKNLEYFKNNIQADFYFKRSFNNKILEYKPTNCSVYPLGLNYKIDSEDRFSLNLRNTLKRLLQNNKIFSKYFNTKLMYNKNFEFYPIFNRQNKVLFITRLWDPEDTTLERLKEEREILNEQRINYIKICQKEFGKNFLGGLQGDDFTTRRAKELIMPFSLTNRETYINTMKQYNICIATTGLHKSIGWKFAEYVAAARAIITEPLEYEVPGEFAEEKNYSVFNNEEELLNKIELFLREKRKVLEMMNNNFYYYNNFLKPEVLVLNTLLKVYEHI